MDNLLSRPVRAINIGISGFADAINATGGEAVTLDWTPPAAGDTNLGRALAKLMGDPAVEEANKKAFAAYSSAQPRLVGVGRAKDVLNGLPDRAILHAGPPCPFERMAGPVQGAVLGAILFEGWAANLEEARALAESGDIFFAPCHQFNAVGPMAGIVCPTMPIWVVEDPVHGNRTFASFNEGLGKVLRFGANNDEVMNRLTWMRDVMLPTLADCLQGREPIDILPLMAQALHMGDEVHNRNAAASSLLLKKLLPGLLESALPRENVAATVNFIAGNDHFFLNISMAACKAMLMAAHSIPNSTMLTVMARNGTEFGIKISGAGDTWFTAPAPEVQGLFFAGFTAEDAARDIGDSAITETAGVGAFAMAAAPAIVKFVGGTPADALGYTEEMGNITLGRNNALTLPMLNFAGTPAGIDLRAVVDTGIRPVINTGIAHKEAGVGQIGAGISRAPLECFTAALQHMAKLREEAKA